MKNFLPYANDTKKNVINCTSSLQLCYYICNLAQSTESSVGMNDQGEKIIVSLLDFLWGTS